MEAAILYREELNEYDFGPGHPFHGRRGEKFLEFLKKKLPEKIFSVLKAKIATNGDLSLICKKDYVEFTKKFYRAANLGEDFDGKFYHYHSIDNLPIGKPGKVEEAARIIIGQAKLACDLIQSPPPKFGGGVKKIISIGGGLHHAKANYGEGFCIYNDVAFCAKYLMEKYKLKKILILDTDAHAGNGTMEYFYDDPRVLLIDLHQDPKTLYPGTGFINQKGFNRGEGFTVNIPLPPFAGDNSYRIVFEKIVEPLVKEFKPQIIIRNGGSDPHFADQLTNLGLSIEGFKMIGEKVRELAKICNGKEIDLIASGYTEKVLPFAWLALISGLIGTKIEIKESMPLPKFLKDPVEETKEVIREIKKELKNYWRCFT